MAEWFRFEDIAYDQPWPSTIGYDVKLPVADEHQIFGPIESFHTASTFDAVVLPTVPVVNSADTSKCKRKCLAPEQRLKVKTVRRVGACMRCRVYKEAVRPQDLEEGHFCTHVLGSVMRIHLARDV